MRTILKTILIAAILLNLGIANAQEANPLARHPGDVIRYEIKFDGLNADKIKTVTASMNTGVTPPKDQVGFVNGFGTSDPVSSSALKTFIVQMTVPKDAATGDYRLYVIAQADDGRASYSDGQDFNVAAIHIENLKTFTPPGIKVAPLP